MFKGPILWIPEEAWKPEAQCWEPWTEVGKALVSNLVLTEEFCLGISVAYFFCVIFFVCPLKHSLHEMFVILRVSCFCGSVVLTLDPINKLKEIMTCTVLTLLLYLKYFVTVANIQKWMLGKKTVFEKLKQRRDAWRQTKVEK